MTLDTLDKKILNNLTVDARQSARQLALKLGVSTVTILSRMKKLPKDPPLYYLSCMLDEYI